jgi:hypothetical protein
MGRVRADGCSGDCAASGVMFKSPAFILLSGAVAASDGVCGRADVRGVWRRADVIGVSVYACVCDCVCVCVWVCGCCVLFV